MKLVHLANWHSRWASLAFCLILLLTSLALTASHVSKHSQVSPIDEYVYIDYLSKVGEQLVVRSGEETGDFARQYLACNGVRLWGLEDPEACLSPASKADTTYPYGGKTSADAYTPLYFVATAAFASFFQFLGMGLVDSGRLAGGVWLGAAAILLFISMRFWAIPRLLSFGAALVIVSIPGAYWSNTYVSTDASSLFAGALMLCLGSALLLKHAWRKVTLIAYPIAGVLVVLLKFQNLLALLTISIWLATLSIFRKREWPWSKTAILLVSVLALFLALTFQVLWLWVRKVLAIGAVPDQGVGEALTPTKLALEAVKFFPGVSTGGVDPSVLGASGTISVWLLSLIVVVGVLGTLLSLKGPKAERFLSGSALFVLMTAGPMLAFANYLVAGFYFDLPTRYALSVVPILIFLFFNLLRRLMSLRSSNISGLSLSLVFLVLSLNFDGG